MREGVEEIRESTYTEADIALYWAFVNDQIILRDLELEAEFDRIREAGSQR